MTYAHVVSVGICALNLCTCYAVISFSCDRFALTHANALDSFSLGMITVANTNAVWAQGLGGRAFIKPTARQTGDSTFKGTHKATAPLKAHTGRQRSINLYLYSVAQLVATWPHPAASCSIAARFRRVPVRDCKHVGSKLLVAYHGDGVTTIP